jgi:hypothetical protein
VHPRARSVGQDGTRTPSMHVLTTAPNMRVHHGAKPARSSRRLPSLTSPQVLTKALKQLEQHMRDLSYSPSDHISVSSALIGEADSQGVLTMWDLPGGKDYGSVLQPYLCDGSVYLLVVPALDVSILKTMYELYVGRWLNALRLGAPNATVIPVMTKGDLLMSAERRDRSSAVLEAACAPQVEWLKSRLEQFQDSVPEHMPKLKIRIDLFSCVCSAVGGEASVEVRA